MGSKFSEISQEPYIFMIQYTEEFQEKIDDLKKGLAISFPKSEINSYRVAMDDENVGKSSCEIWLLDSKRERRENQKPFETLLVYQNDISGFNEDSLVEKLKEIKG